MVRIHLSSQVSASRQTLSANADGRYLWTDSLTAEHLPLKEKIESSILSRFTVAGIVDWLNGSLPRNKDQFDSGYSLNASVA